MLHPVNLQEKLLKTRNKELKNFAIDFWIKEIFADLDKAREATKSKLEVENDATNFNQFDIDHVDSNAIFHISQIKKICIDYRLRFLDTSFFKGDFPEEAITKIHELETLHDTSLESFKIIAPSVLFRLKKADDPILFAPMGNDYYYLIHKWGNDLHPLRKLKFWFVKDLDNFIFTLLALCFLFSIATHTFFFREHSSISYFIVLFMFYFKGAVGLSLLWGVSLGKNFNKYIWQSKYDKVS
ncbi:hypothetical protein [uncultured Tenacibaculum sp.]|uniref:hypothetical protein n=1 Tax=uncultured Tenacibaculum sp. TaxID=174713 RepID=UPI0026361FA2|nr:hypothetical protein [uncultured Tenacibaculum sp.]